MIESPRLHGGDMGSEEHLPRINSEKWGMVMENIFLVSQSPDHETGGMKHLFTFQVYSGRDSDESHFSGGGH